MSVPQAVSVPRPQRPAARLPTTATSAASATDSHARSALAAAGLGFFVITLDTVVVNVALPTMRADLGGGVTGLQWVPMALFRSATFNIVVVIGFAFMVGYYGTPFLFSLYFQTDRGLSSLTAGLAFLPMMLIGAALTPFSARIVERTGLAGPLVMPPATAALLSSVPAHRSGVTSGVFNTSRQVGGALAVAVFGALTATSDGFLHGQRISLTITAGVALAAAAAALALETRPAPKETS